MTFKNDMTMMYAMHDALRRDLDRIARIAARPEDDPKHVLRTAVGWEMFKSYLEVHHTAEDDLLWPPMRTALADDPDGTALLNAMEVEHAVIDPMLTAIETALADRDSGPQRLGELTDALAVALRDHLRHEEVDGLPLIDATITQEQWAGFGVGSGQRIAGDLHRYFPWMLDRATPEVTTAVLDRLPPPIQQAYRDEWQPGYAKLTLWA